MAIESGILKKYGEAQKAAKKEGHNVSEKTRYGFQSLLNQLRSVLTESGTIDDSVTDSEILKDEGLIRLFNTPELKNFFHNLTPTARHAVFQARNEAWRFGDDFIGTEHLFLALARIEYPVSAISQRYRMDIKPELVNATLKESPEVRDKVETEKEDLFFLPSVLVAFEVAGAEAHRLGYAVSTDFLIIGLTSASDEKTVVAKLLAKMGVINRKDLHERMLANNPPQPRQG